MEYEKTKVKSIAGGRSQKAECFEGVLYSRGRGLAMDMLGSTWGEGVTNRKSEQGIALLYERVSHLLERFKSRPTTLQERVDYIRLLHWYWYRPRMLPATLISTPNSTLYTMTIVPLWVGCAQLIRAYAWRPPCAPALSGEPSSQSRSHAAASTSKERSSRARLQKGVGSRMWGVGSRK